MELTVLAGAAATCALGGILPWISAEAVLLGAALALPPALLPALVLSCASGQMLGKGGLYAVMRWAPHRLPDRARKVLGRVEPLSRRPRILGGSVFTGAAAGLPPFYVVTLASGLAGLPVVTFALAGFVGCILRYGVVVWGAGALGWGG
jgi:membrane protein YqaA with SNARE-associated domain